MRINLFVILLTASVIFGIKAVWTSRLQIAARRQILGTLARRIGWCMIAMPVFAAASVAACIGVLKLINYEDTLAYGQGSICGIVLVLLVSAYVANRLKRYGVPIKTNAAPIDWTNVDVKPAAPRFDILEQEQRTTNEDGEEPTATEIE